jgi:hypothetical protein
MPSGTRRLPEAAPDRPDGTAARARVEYLADGDAEYGDKKRGEDDADHNVLRCRSLTT